MSEYKFVIAWQKNGLLGIREIVESKVITAKSAALAMKKAIAFVEEQKAELRARGSDILVVVKDVVKL